MKKIIQNSVEYIILSNEEYSSMEVVHGCSGTKYLIGDIYFMEDECVDVKNYYQCLKKEFDKSLLFFNQKIIQAIANTMEISVDFDDHKAEKQLFLKQLFPDKTEEQINTLYSLTLNACRRYTSANVFKIARIEIGTSRINRYILFSEIAKIMGLKDCVPMVTKSCLKNNEHTINGCSIEKIEGIDAAHWSSLDRSVKDSLIDFQMTETGYRDLTSIHLLDYLTGQVDRNFTNIIYRLNSQGHISKCITIDNDVCFGCSTIDDLKITRLGDLSHIVCIDKHLCNTLKGINRGALNNTLKSYITPDEISFFWDRFDQLQKAISHMKMVELDEWKNYRDVLNDHPYIQNFRLRIKEMDS